MQIAAFTFALPRLASTGYALIVCLEFVTVVLAGVLILGERLSPLQWTGIILVLGGILIERLASGRWLDAYGGRERLRPGQVPWEAFELEEARRVLSEVDWTISAKPNERDALWERFEGLFK